MKKDNEKGFALVLSLVLLLVMSLMGGSLIVISSGDHQNNTTSDKYQQTFYVAETALLEGEKYVINQYLGPRTTSATRDISKRNKPINAYETNETDCYNSFPKFPPGFEVVIHSVNLDPATNEHNAATARIFNFGALLNDVFTQKHKSFFGDIEAKVFIRDEKEEVAVSSGEFIDKEKAYLDEFEYEYFITKLGPAPFRGFGTSIKKGSSDLGLDGIAYRIYGCGTYTKSPEIIIPLESTIVLPD